MVNSLYAGLPQHNGELKKNMLTTREVARIFSVHPSTIRRWSDQGKIKAYRTGPRGVRMFKREDIAIAYLDRGIRYCLKNI
jgi:excisionase family DNA binding protein